MKRPGSPIHTLATRITLQFQIRRSPNDYLTPEADTPRGGTSARLLEEERACRMAEKWLAVSATEVWLGDH